MTFMVTAAILFGLVTAQSGQWSLKDGTKVSVIFVLPSEKQAWRPDGAPVQLRSIPKPSLPVWSGTTANSVIAVFLNPSTHPKMAPIVKFKLPADPPMRSQRTVPCLNNRNWINVYDAGPNQPFQQDIAVGISLKNGSPLEWHTIRAAYFKPKS